MRRSTAPSQVRKGPGVDALGCSSKTVFPMKQKNEEDEGGADITIERLPLFDFLSIPDPLKRQFILPKGCVISAEGLALRKVKTLGLRKNFRVIRPGDLGCLPPRSLLVMEDIPPPPAEDDEEEEQEDKSEYPPFEPLVLWSHPDDSSKKIEVIPQLACRLRPHQREGVQFLFECTMGLRGFEGQGCILADDMGLGKTLMSITLLWTLLNQGFEGTGTHSAVQKAMVVCPTSLVGNWENELKRWVGDNCPTFAVHSEPKKIIKQFVQHRGKGILIISYETQRRYSEMFHPGPKSALLSYSGSPCELLICDEAHKLKNSESELAKSLMALPAKKRILLSGTPMQNELSEFFNMVDFCNPGVLGSSSHFRRTYERPILLSREPDATDAEKQKASKLQKELSTIVNEFILKRGNILNARHLPPKLVQYVCCRNTQLQNELYDIVIKSKNLRHLRDGKQMNTLNSLRHLLQITSHPDLILQAHKQKGSQHDEELDELANHIVNYYNSMERSSKKPSPSDSGVSRGGILSGSLSRSDRSLVRASNKSAGSGMKSGFDPELSGKFLVLFRLMFVLRTLPTKDRIVIISNSTQTLDLVETMCKDNAWPWLRLDGTTNATKRTKLVAEFNDLKNNSFAFLLSSKAGGCGINLIGGNRLVLFDPDWNPASDKQAAGRIWREGQLKRCYIYRFMGTCTIEEKIIQRQLSKEGLQNIVDDKDQVNQFSTNELKSIFTRRTDTRSDTHDTLRCKRCSNVKILSNVGAEIWQQMNPVRAAKANEFLQNLRPKIEAADSLIAQASEEEEKENLILEYDQIITGLNEGKFPTLPIFSKHVRDTIKMIDFALNKAVGSSTLFSEFLDSWSHLSQLMYQKECSNETTTEEDADDEEEYVEQEGCPGEEDFNRWSHHCSPNTCDDEALKQALNDDTTVSFVFGLEVNWSLLQEKLAVEMEAEEKRKEQQRLDLLELNARRARERQKSNPLSQGAAEEEADEESDQDDTVVKDDDMDIVKDAEEKESSRPPPIDTKKQKKRVHEDVAESKTTNESGGRRKSKKEEAKEKTSKANTKKAVIAAATSSKKQESHKNEDSEVDDDFIASPEKCQRIEIVSSDDDSDVHVVEDDDEGEVEDSKEEEGKVPLPSSQSNASQLQQTSSKKRVSFQEGTILESLQNLTPQSQQTQLIPDPEPPGRGKWECWNCTYHNLETSTSCDMCRSHKTRNKKERRSTDSLLSSSSSSSSLPPSSQMSQSQSLSQSTDPFDEQNGVKKSQSGGRSGRGLLALPKGKK